MKQKAIWHIIIVTFAEKNYADQNGTQQLSRVMTDKLPKPTEPQKYYNDCKYCGEVHGGAFGWLIKFFHSILALFGLRK